MSDTHGSHGSTEGQGFGDLGSSPETVMLLLFYFKIIFTFFCCNFLFIQMKIITFPKAHHLPGLL